MLWCQCCILLLGFSRISLAQPPEDVDDGEDLASSPVNMKATIGKKMMKIQWKWPSPRPNYFIVRYNDNSLQVNDTLALLTNLQPFTNYSVSVLACTENCASIAGPQVYRTKMGTPGMVENFELSPANSSHVLLSWDAPRMPAGPNQYYHIRIVDQDGLQDINSTANSIPLLRPACKNGASSAFQKVFVRGVSVDNSSEAKPVERAGNSSSPVIFYVDCLRESAQELAESLRVDKLSVLKTAIKLWWNSARPLKNNSFYLVTYNDKSVQVRKTDTTLRNLEPNTMYTIKVSVCTTITNCSASTAPIDVRTKKGVPDKVENLGVNRVNSTSYLVSWQPPSTTYGQKLTYQVSIKSSLGERNFDTDQQEAFFSTTNCKSEASNISYTVVVAAMNPKDGAGEPVNASVFVPCSPFEVRPPQFPSIDIGTTWVELLWNEAAGDSLYLVKFNDTQVVANTSLRLEASPNTNYELQLYQCAQDCSSKSFFGSVKLKTKPLILIGVRNLSILDVNLTHFHVSWQPPMFQNSVFFYQVTVSDELSLETKSTNVDIPKSICKPNQPSFTIRVKILYLDSEYVADPTTVTMPKLCSKLESTFTKIVLLYNSELFLEWTPVDSGSSDSVYRVIYNKKTITVKKNSARLSQLKPSTKFDIRVQTCTDDKCHTLTKVLTVQTADVGTHTVKPYSMAEMAMKLINSSHGLFQWNPRSTATNGGCYHMAEIRFSNSSQTDPANSKVFPLSYLFEKLTDETVCNSSDIAPESVLKQFQQTLGIEEVVETHVSQVVTSPTTIELAWNATRNTDYRVMSNGVAYFVSAPSIQLTGLKPGTNYVLEIFKCSPACNTLILGKFTVRTPPLLVAVENITFTASPSVVTVSWQPPSSGQWQYRVLLEAGTEYFESTWAKSFAQLTLPEFDSQLEVVARITPLHSDPGVVGVPSVASIKLQPAPALDYQVDVTEDQITLAWNDSAADAATYLVKCNDTAASSNSTSATFTALAPSTWYHLQVLKCQHSCTQRLGSLVVRTQGSATAKVKDLRLQEVNSSHLHVTWNAPVANSSQLGYDIRLDSQDGTALDALQTENASLYLPNQCSNNSWPEVYKISVRPREEHSAWSTILMQCPPVLASNTYLMEKSFTWTTNLVMVALAGFLVGAAVCACTCKTFTYTYKLK